MRRISVRVDDYVYERVNFLSKENKVSLNKIISNIIIEYLKRPNEILSCLDNFNESLNIIKKELNEVSKRQISHFKVSKQHFANHGYLSNADINEDKCLKELLNKEDNFND